MQRTSDYKSNLAGYGFLVFSVALILLYAGGFTTTIGAGMVFEDWPLSNGSLNPEGWTTDQAMMAEHSHRLLGSTVGSLCIGLVIWMYRREGRAWLRRLSYLALGLVIFQGLLGGMRVLFVSGDLAMIHGVTAQLFLCTLVAVAVGSSRWWRNVPVALAKESEVRWLSQRRLGILVWGLLVGQLILGAVMRHRGAGMAIPYFPMSTAEGSLLPDFWNWAVTLHFAHRLMAVIVATALTIWVCRVFLSSEATTAMKRLGGIILCLVVIQIGLGAGIIWSIRKPFETTLHVLNGAILLSATFSLAFA